MDTVADYLNLLYAMKLELVAGGLAGCPELDVPVKPVGPAFLGATNPIQRKSVERIPDRAEHFMNKCDAVRPAPPRGEPRNAMVLVNDEIKPGLRTAPPASVKNRSSFPAAADDLNAVNRGGGRTAGESVCKPVDLVTALRERRQIALRDTLRATRKGVLGIAPVEHQKTHGGLWHRAKLMANGS